MDDGITDEELLALAAASSTQAAPAASSTSSAPASTAGPPRSFTAAFASMTASSLYTDVGKMPMPAPSSKLAAPPAVPPAAAAAVAALAKPQSAHSILVSPRQRGNPVLQHIANVSWEMGPKEMAPDYVLGETCCALYLSLKYHLLHVNYVAARMAGVGAAFTLRVLLLLVDVDDSERPLLELTQTCFAYGWTLVCCWSVEEVARYLETFRAYEKKTAAAIAERVDESDHASKLLEALTEVRSINKTDVRHLAAQFGSFAAIAQATPDDLQTVPGMGERKVRRLHHVMTQPFITAQMARRNEATGGPAVTTPAQAAAAHAAAMAKAAAAAAVPAKKSAIMYVNQMPHVNAGLPPAAPGKLPASLPQTGIPATSAAPPTAAAASASVMVAPPSASTSSAAPTSSLPASASAAPALTPPSSATSAAAVPARPPAPVAPTPAPVVDYSDFIS